MADNLKFYLILICNYIKEEHVAKHNIKYYSIMGIIGLINNLGYVLVGSASQEISDKFEKNELMGLF